jgi:hypothetical protein
METIARLGEHPHPIESVVRMTDDGWLVGYGGRIWASDMGARSDRGGISDAGYSLSVSLSVSVSPTRQDRVPYLMRVRRRPPLFLVCPPPRFSLPLQRPSYPSPAREPALSSRLDFPSDNLIARLWGIGARPAIRLGWRGPRPFPSYDPSIPDLTFLTTSTLPQTESHY